ncbi:MAG TPA: hypothetical protein VGN88_10925 [Phycisphaerae bacterium]|jgi:hypothetical protein
MGDFDRHENNSAPKQSETKKMVAVLGLGVVLIAVVAFEFLKKSPQAAVGAPVDSASGILPPPVVDGDISPAALTGIISELKNDPTKNLLRSGMQADPKLDEVPRNPFVISPTWVKALTKQEVVQQQPEPRPIFQSSSTPPPPPPPPPLVLKPEEYKLNSLISAVDGMNAIINGKIARVGSVIDSAVVVEIGSNSVILQHVNSPNSPKLEIKMGPK